MNLIGYFESQEVWIPDPVLEQQGEFKKNNALSEKEKEPDA